MYLRPQSPPLPLFALCLFPHAQEVQEGKEQAAVWKEKKYREKKERENQPPASPRTEFRHEMRGRKRRRTSVGVWSGRAPASVGCVEAVKVSVKVSASKLCKSKSLSLWERDMRNSKRSESAVLPEPSQQEEGPSSPATHLSHSCHSPATVNKRTETAPQQW
jgi:hypothetical protein